MPVWNTAKLSQRQIDSVNLGLTALTLDANGNYRGQGFYQEIAEYFNVSRRTVMRWFGADEQTTRNFQGCIPGYCLDKRPAFLNPPPDRNGNARRRIWLAACAGYGGDNGQALPPIEPAYQRGDWDEHGAPIPRTPTRLDRPNTWPTGFERDPVFTGEDMTFDGLPYELHRFGTITECITMIESIYEGTSKKGPFWELAWYRFDIVEAPDEWHLRVFYRGRALGEGSDAIERETDSDGVPIVEYNPDSGEDEE